MSKRNFKRLVHSKSYQNIAEDADLDAYMKEVKQEFANIGFEGVRAPEVGGNPKDDSDAIASLINKGTENIVKQNQN